ncbi:MAG TPA: IclR family transcriptional regulator [Egibacteraceae bacterium]|nr:IclR family transcriptional regulator [Egibacteraceae bacterium]
MSPPPKAEGGAYTVRAISRAAQVLGLIQHSSAPMALNQVVKLSELSKPTVFRMLRNLEDVGLVERVPGTDAYRLGLRCVALGQAYLEQADYRREALPILESLRDRYSETVHLAVLDTELRVVYVEKLEGKHAVGIMMSRVGRSAPSYCTGLGKALLSSLDDDPAARLAARGELVRKTDNTICDADQLRSELAAIRARGFSLDLEEHETGVRCVAANVQDASGAVVAAISVAGPVQRMPHKLLTGELAEATVAAARGISRRLGAVDHKAPS